MNVQNCSTTWDPIYCTKNGHPMLSPPRVCYYSIAGYMQGGLHVFHLGGANPTSDKFLHFRPVTLREFCFICDRFLGGRSPPHATACSPPCSDVCIYLISIHFVAQHLKKCFYTIF